MDYLLKHSSFLALLFITIIKSINGDPCQPGNHRVMLDAESRSAGIITSRALCDSRLDTGWYKVTSKAGEDMPTTCPSQNRCGTIYPIWMNGTIPPEDGMIHQRKAAIHVYGDCVFQEYNISVKNCGSYRVYYLVQVDSCTSAYCFGEGYPCPDGYSSSNGYSPCSDGLTEVQTTRFSESGQKNTTVTTGAESSTNLSTTVESDNTVQTTIKSHIDKSPESTSSPSDITNQKTKLSSPPTLSTEPGNKRLTTNNPTVVDHSEDQTSGTSLPDYWYIAIIACVALLFIVAILTYLLIRAIRNTRQRPQMFDPPPPYKKNQQSSESNANIYDQTRSLNNFKDNITFKDRNEHVNLEKKDKERFDNLKNDKIDQLYDDALPTHPDFDSGATQLDPDSGNHEYEQVDEQKYEPLSPARYMGNRSSADTNHIYLTIDHAEK